MCKKTNEILSSEARNGEYRVFHPKSQSFARLSVTEPVPAGFTSLKQRHVHVMEFRIAAAMRKEGLEDAFFESFMNFIKLNDSSVSFSDECMPTRNDFQFRLEKLGFTRNKKTKKVFLNLFEL